MAVKNAAEIRRYMVLERFKEGMFDAVYERFEQQGRMLPAGLEYLDSWASREKNICYQLMQTHDESLFDAWITHWHDLVDFEIALLD